MRAGYLLMRLIFGLLFLWVRQLGYQPLQVVVLLVLGLVWGSKFKKSKKSGSTSQSLSLYSPYIHSFSIIDSQVFPVRSC